MIIKQIIIRRAKSTKSFFEMSTRIRRDTKRNGESSVSFLSMFIGFGFCKSSDKILCGHYNRNRGFTIEKIVRIISELLTFIEAQSCNSSAHLSLSSGENFQGAKLFSILLYMPFHSAG